MSTKNGSTTTSTGGSGAYIDNTADTPNGATTTPGNFAAMTPTGGGAFADTPDGGVGGSGGLERDGSQQELLGFNHEFSDEQIRNFQHAFRVFDTNQDGLISTEEILDALNGMGPGVSPQRKLQIISAVKQVDPQGSGQMQFHQFIHFMRIMDEYNKVDNKKPKINPNDIVRTTYGRCCSIWIRQRGLTIPFCDFLNWFFLTLNLLHAIFIYVVFALSEDRFEHQLQQVPDPTRDENSVNFENHFGFIIEYMRYINYVNIVIVLVTVIDPKHVDAVREILGRYKLRERTSNVFKFLVRQIFVLNAAANILLIAGRKGIGADDFMDNWYFYVVAGIQIIITYLQLAPMFYFAPYAVPNKTVDYCKVATADLLYLNFIRFFLILFKNIFAILMLPAVIFLGVFRLFSFCCCKGCFNFIDDSSRTRRFYRLASWLQG